jgi:hypothetical protein
VIDRQSVGPVRAVPEPADRQPVWRITRGDGRYRDIEHLDPLHDQPDNPTRHVPDWVIPLVAVSAGILAIVLWAVLRQH